MTEKPEPLTKKKISYTYEHELLSENDVHPSCRVAVIGVIDVKSAVLFLLEEIEKERKEKDRKWYEFFDSASECDGYLKALKDVEDLIKKAFSGVLDND